MNINKNNHNLNALRILGVEAINKANSGHPGIVLGAAPIVYTLFNKIMKHNPKNPNWFDRDRFILSAGHGSGLLYSALHLAGYDVSINDLKKFRQLNSKTPGHPESHLTQGVEVTTGPLGQGIAMGVGFAVAEAHLASIFNKNNDLINHNTFVLCGDGDLQEGVSYESISFAGRQKLNKLILIHDSNDIQLDTEVKAVQSEDLHLRFKSCGWDTFKIEDGEDLELIESTILKAQSSDKPSYIEVKTIIGIGATNQGTTGVHGAPVGNDILNVKSYFGWNEEEFVIPKDVYKHWEQNCIIKNEIIEKEWIKKLSLLDKELLLKFNKHLNNEINFDFMSLLNEMPLKNEATRVSSGNIFDKINNSQTNLIGGSADLVGSTKIKGADGIFDINNRSGRNILYGVREFAMGGINNGIYKHGGLIPFASGFFVFADYMKPAIRLASIMENKTLFIFTHDSIAVGEDGPTHQPVEQLAMIRSIPNHMLFRPCDYAETLASYEYMLNKLKKTPSSLILTRQDLKQLPHNNVFEEVSKGAYIIKDEKDAQITLIATGSEVELAISVSELLDEQNFKTKVVSMPSTNLFDQQSQTYKDSIIDKNTLRISIEMGTTYGWDKYTGDNGLNFGIDKFGASAPAIDVIKEYGFTKEQIFNTIIKVIRKEK
ncbi:transketolase [Entomoplasma ellychniae]|uniref:Transketolase n=1 Tax=Entomoplasma ellychniae TaxID=2114 RepID=A0A8E2UAI0_9MOLU|nr:transketolase [Entomoplasma ellychniae]PPE04546.1 transketolase [Entomoplasma ellychniae]